MYFQHSNEIWRDFPELVPGVLLAEGITAGVPVDGRVATFSAVAAARLEGGPEGGLPEIQAWRRAYSRMGLKPTQYRCAAESLLRRFRREGNLPRIHPLVDACNAISLAFAIPIAIFDVDRITDCLVVRYATGEETYLTFAGDVEHPDPGEVIFADGAGRAHARRWSNRQSGDSAVRETTATVLVVAEAMHGSARPDIERLVATVAGELEASWSVAAKQAVLDPSSPTFEP